MAKLVNVQVESKYNSNRVGEEYYIELSIPLPGGTARYEFNISKEQYNSIDFAYKLSQQK